MSRPDDTLLSDLGPDDGSSDAAWMRTFDSLYCATLDEPQTQPEPLPQSLRERLQREGAAAVSQRSPTGPSRAVAASPVLRRIGPLGWIGWGLAAALALGFFILGLPVPPAAATADLMAQVDSAPDMVTWPFNSQTEEFKSSAGTVVWSSRLQKGYMRFKGVPRNDFTKAQYQLWIVDPARDSKPVDGGVFDLVTAPGSPDEQVVPIHAKLAIGRPAAFAVTREQPGGVVVSAGPLLLVAKP